MLNDDDDSALSSSVGLTLSRRNNDNAFFTPQRRGVTMESLKQQQQKRKDSVGAGGGVITNPVATTISSLSSPFNYANFIDFSSDDQNNDSSLAVSSPQQSTMTGYRRSYDENLVSTNHYSSPVNVNGSAGKFGTLPKSNTSFDCAMNNNFTTTSIDQSSSSMSMTSSLYEWRTFNENCAKLIAEPNLIMKMEDDQNNSSISKSGHNQSKIAGDVEILQDLFRENICSLYNDIIDACNCSDTDQSDIEALGSRYGSLLQRTNGILSVKMPNLAQEINSRLLSVRTLLNYLAENAPCIPNAAGCTHLKNFRIWLQMETDKLKRLSELHDQATSHDQLKELLYYQQALQSEIERDGRLLLEAAQKEINDSSVDSGFSTTTASSSTTNCASTNSDTEQAFASTNQHRVELSLANQQQPIEFLSSANQNRVELSPTNHNQAHEISQPTTHVIKSTNHVVERRRRVLSSLETRWKRLRLSALEFTVFLEAKLEQGWIIPKDSERSLDEPPSKIRRFNQQNTSTPITVTTISRIQDVPITNRCAEKATISRNDHQQQQNNRCCLDQARSLASSISSDVIPFPENEYEPIMDSIVATSLMTNRNRDIVESIVPDQSGNSSSPLHHSSSFGAPLDDNGNFIVSSNASSDTNNRKRDLSGSEGPDKLASRNQGNNDSSNDVGYSSEHFSSTDENSSGFYANEAGNVHPNVKYANEVAKTKVLVELQQQQAQPTSISKSDWTASGRLTCDDLKASPNFKHANEACALKELQFTSSAQQRQISNSDCSNSDQYPNREDQKVPTSPQSVCANVNYANDATNFSGSQSETAPPPLQSQISTSNWSASSSPSLERRRRIHNSPIKDYYKMFPDDTVDTDSEMMVHNGITSKCQQPSANAATLNNGGTVPEDAHFVYTTKFFHSGGNKSSLSPNGQQESEMTDSLVVNVSKSKENLNDEALQQIVALMDESFEQRGVVGCSAVGLSGAGRFSSLNQSVEQRLDAKMRDLFYNTSNSSSGCQNYSASRSNNGYSDPIGNNRYSVSTGNNSYSTSTDNNNAKNFNQSLDWGSPLLLSSSKNYANFNGTTWIPFLADSKTNLHIHTTKDLHNSKANLHNSTNLLMMDNDQTSNDADGSELSLEDYNDENQPPIDLHSENMGHSENVGQVQGQGQAQDQQSIIVRRNRLHSSSLKRRWQRFNNNVEISTPKALNWSSEMALTNHNHHYRYHSASQYDSSAFYQSSASASVTSSSTNRNRGANNENQSTNGGRRSTSRRRLKLTATRSQRRLPRSISDSEHLSVLALCQRSCRPTVSRSNMIGVTPSRAPPCTPCDLSSSSSNESLLADDDDDQPPRDSDDDVIDGHSHIMHHHHLEGAGESLFILNDHQQRMAGDGHSTVSESITGSAADQSDSIYYEWDDYKPPDHNECGPPDIPLDDSKLTEFGDDYRSWIDSAPPSARSDISECFTNSPYLRRLSPVGRCTRDSVQNSSINDIIALKRHSGGRNLKIPRRRLFRRKNYMDFFAKCQRDVTTIENLHTTGQVEPKEYTGTTHLQSSVAATCQLSRLAAYSLPLQLFLLGLCLGLYFVHPDACNRMYNAWTWSTGFKLDYVGDPPPT